MSASGLWPGDRVIVRVGAGVPDADGNSPGSYLVTSNRTGAVSLIRRLALEAFVTFRGGDGLLGWDANGGVAEVQP